MPAEIVRAIHRFISDARSCARTRARDADSLGIVWRTLDATRSRGDRAHIDDQLAPRLPVVGRRAP
ncbi:MAG TPA: hypothetical protein VJ717_20330 [Gemmatimonadaceae bacterium]|nr:hypothetical protein [Gemmatimonadaceae bacterium]